MYITASKLYDYIQCPHKVWRDQYGPQEEKMEPNPFVELLWEKGLLHEKEVVKTMGSYTDLSRGSINERYNKTIKELKRGTSLIYQGLLIHKDLLGVPDILKKMPDETYMPIDIKSGSGYENVGEYRKGKLKKHYALQLCMYSELLKEHGFKKDDIGIIIDIDGKEVEYILDNPQGSRKPSNWLDEYRKVLSEVRSLVSNKKKNKPALGGACRLCPWYYSCRDWCEKEDDLSTIFFLGRSKRDIINRDLKIKRVSVISECDISQILNKKKQDKSILKGLGKKTIEKIICRANIIKDGKPAIYRRADFPKADIELFFDIEDDPTQEFIYLHGIFERRKSGHSKYVYFLAKENTPEEEYRIWEEFWSYIKSLPQDNFSLYYYSPHEKTAFKKLREKYNGPITEKELDNFFNNKNVVDLYQNVIYKYTDWPLWSYSLKDIATYIGFSWRDKTPSGALSIQWYNKYIETGDPDIIKRILAYNEDDCKATMIIKDKIQEISDEKYSQG